jgi:hypothetical protein
MSRGIIAFSLALAGVAGVAGCASSRPHELSATRFHNQPIVWLVNDRNNVPEPPAMRRFFQALYHFDGHWHGRIDRWMQMRPPHRALSTNALDEVPDSTWFENRIGQRDLSPADVATGPNHTGSPEAHTPWVIKSSKVGGKTVGYIIEDQRGVKYVLKFDEKGIPEVETGADVIVQRLLWAWGDQSLVGFLFC